MQVPNMSFQSYISMRSILRLASFLDEERAGKSFAQSHIAICKSKYTAFGLETQRHTVLNSKLLSMALMALHGSFLTLDEEY